MHLKIVEVHYGKVSHSFKISSSDGRLKIADLGLSRIFLTAEDEKKGHKKRHYSHQVATRWYR